MSLCMRVVLFIWDVHKVIGEACTFLHTVVGCVYISASGLVTSVRLGGFESMCICMLTQCHHFISRLELIVDLRVLKIGRAHV